MKKKATRTYRDLKSRTTQKSRVRQYDRIPGEQFDADRALDEGYLNVEEVGGMDVAEEVDPGDVDVVTELAPPEFEPEASQEQGYPTEMSDEIDVYKGGEDESEEDDEEEQEDMDYEEGMEVKDEDIEEVYYDGETPPEADPYSDEDGDDGKAEACDGRGPKMEATMLKRSEGSFAERLRMAMDPSMADPSEEGLMSDLGEEVGMEPEAPATEGPCPAGCEPVTTEEAPPAEDEGIVEVGEDEVTFLDEEPKEAAVEDEPAEEVFSTAPASVEAAEEAGDEPVYETLGNIEALADVGTDRVDLILTREESENPQYVVLVDGDPVAKVALSDQPESLTADHDLFMDEDYPKFVLESVDTFGLRETLQHVNARYYTASAMEGEVAQQMRTAAVHDLEGEHRQRLAEMKDQLLNTANIVLEGSLKNYITDNPLRDSLVRRMRSVNVDERAALDIVEAAFREKGSDFFRAIIKKAEEWVGAPSEVLEHHVKEITQMNYRHPGYSAEGDEIPMEEPPVISASSVPSSIPLRTVASAPHAPQHSSSTREQLKQELNLHGLLVQKSLANRPQR
jgi:hypothetical protein